MSDDEAPFERLRNAFRHAFQRVEPGEEVPEIPAELREWTQNTAVAGMAGMLFGGGREYLAIRRLGKLYIWYDKEITSAGPYRPQEAGLTKAQIARAIAEENTQRMLRFSRKAIGGCLKFGSLAGLFYAVQKLNAVANAQESLSDTIIGAAVTGGVAGAFLPGPAPLKIRSSLLGTIFGGVVGYPTGLLQHKVDERLRESQPDRRPAKRGPPPPKYPLLSGNPAEGVIKQLEASKTKDDQ